MAALQNFTTSTIRENVWAWIASQAGGGFTCAQVSKAVQLLLPELSGVDLCKGVSNELIRMVDKGFLSYTMLERNGDSGRPPRLYKQSTGK